MNVLKNHFNLALKRFGKQCTVNGDDSDIVTGIFKEIDNKNSIDTKYFMSMDTLQQGDILTYNEIDYIVNTKNDNINDVYDIYEIEKSHLNFNLAVNSVLYSQVGVQYVSSLGFNYGQVVIVEGKSVLKVQSNDITKQITINTRYIKNGQVWKITGINKSMEGLILFTCDIDSIGAGDDMVNEIPNETHFPVTNITVNPNPIESNVGYTQQLTVSVDVEGVPVENLTIIYVSDNTGIATVNSSGLVSGITEGTCNINVTYKNTTVLIPTTISPPFNYVVTTTPSTIPFYVGNTQQLTTTVTNNGSSVSSPTITYSSDNTSIATVNSNGLVTAVAQGTCTITSSFVGEDSNTYTDTVATTVNANLVEVRFSQSYGTLNAQGHLEIYEGDSPAAITVYKYLNNVQQADKFNIVGSNPPSPSSNYHLVGTSNVNSFTVENIYHTATLLTITATSTTDGTVGHYYIELKGAF